MRWLRLTLLVLVGSSALLFAIVLFAVTHLDSPAIKARILALAPLPLDYGTTHLGLHAFSIADVRVDALARVGRVELAWWPLRARVSDVEVTVDLDAPSAPSEGPPVPLSQLGKMLMGNTPPLAHVTVERLSVRVLPQDVRVSGLDAEVAFSPAWRVKLTGGALTHGAREARASLELIADISAEAVRVNARVGSLVQSFAPEVRVGDALTLDATHTFASGTLVVSQLRAIDDDVSATATLFISDDGTLLLRAATAQADLGRLLQVAPLGWSVGKGSLQLEARDVTLAALPKGTLELVLALDELRGAARVGHADVRAKITPDGATHVEAHATAMEASSVVLTGASLVADAQLATRSVDVQVDVARVQAAKQWDAPLRVRVGIKEVDVKALGGRLHLVAEANGPSVTLDATKREGRVDFELAATTPPLAVLRPTSWKQAAVTADGYVLLPGSSRSLSGSSNASAALSFDVRAASATIDRLAAAAAGAEQMRARLHAAGTAARVGFDGDVAADALVVRAQALGTTAVTFSGAVDVANAGVELAVHSAAPALDLSADLAFREAAIRYDVEARLAKVAWLSVYVPTIDFDELALTLSAHGKLLGVIDRARNLVSRPTQTGAVDGSIDLGIEEMHWRHQDRAIDMPKATWHLRFQPGEPRLVQGHLNVADARIGIGARVLEVHALSDALSASLKGDLLEGEVDLDYAMTLGAFRQDFAPGYPIAEATLKLAAKRNKDGVIQLDRLRFDNPRAGTSLTLHGAIEADEVRRRLSLRGALQQDLALLWDRKDVYEGRGKTELDLRFESADLRVIRAIAAIRMEDAFVSLPRAGIQIDEIDGEIPLQADMLITKKGIGLLKSNDANPYSELRYADQHPLLNARSFISVKRIKTPLITIAPLAGNLSIDQNIVSLSQLELGVRGGKITGQCSFDIDGEDSMLTAHVRATGVQSKNGEPFDGNAAMVVSVRQRSVDGRAEINRIGQRHLQDLLDLQDPHHQDAAMNRVRTALAIGYPKHVRMTFNHGFAGVGIQFGGIASLVQIDELRGIPMGPLLDRALAPLNKRRFE